MLFPSRCHGRGNPSIRAEQQRHRLFCVQVCEEHASPAQVTRQADVVTKTFKECHHFSSPQFGSFIVAVCLRNAHLPSVLTTGKIWDCSSSIRVYAAPPPHPHRNTPSQPVFFLASTLLYVLTDQIPSPFSGSWKQVFCFSLSGGFHRLFYFLFNIFQWDRRQLIGKFRNTKAV